MKKGIEFLEDSDVFKTFKLTNLAMLMQQYVTERSDK